MDNQQIRETLEKQLQLLSERSHESDLPVPFICDLTQVMVQVAKVICCILYKD